MLASQGLSGSRMIVCRSIIPTECCRMSHYWKWYGMGFFPRVCKGPAAPCKLDEVLSLAAGGKWFESHCVRDGDPVVDCMGEA